jgi:hypothetical protein
MSSFKRYQRRTLFTLRARPLEVGDVVYDASGQVLEYQPGDMLIELETDRFTLDRTLFDDLYIEVNTSGTDAEKPDVSQAGSTDLGRR